MEVVFMEGRQKGVLLLRKIVTVAVLAGLVLAVGAGGWILTKDKSQKAQKISLKEQKKENEGWENMADNPLLKGEYPQVTRAVEAYYSALGDETSFVEGYENLNVYTKLGKYQDTYVAFVRYDMKIRDVYTGVPGLGTLYVTENEDGKCQVETQVEEDEIHDLVEAVTGHEDVQALLTETQNAYRQAVQSDALLKEALLDLKQAYEDSAGS